MNKENFEKYLEERYRAQIKWYTENSSINKKRFQFLVAITTTFSVFVPVLLVTEDTFLKFLAIGFSAVVAICATFTRSFNFQENWINYRTIGETLKKEIHFYDAKLFDYSSSQDPEALFVSRVENLISRENTTWVGCQQANKK
jgi:hypothetical protein